VPILSLKGVYNMKIKLLNKYSKRTEIFDVKYMDVNSRRYFTLVFKDGSRSQPYNKSIYSWEKLND